MTETSDRRQLQARRFRATIRKWGSTSYVDVPQAVSRAFAPFVRGGRIRFEGALNQTSIRGTLVPVARGGHRLYVNGGMRAAAGVEAGDTVSFSLRAVGPDTVPLPADLAGALCRVKKARAAFGGLSLSHRRELLRYVDDARTPESRRGRIQKTIAHALGKRAPSGRGRRDQPLWTCPRCGNEFVNRNQWHSCRRYELAQVFSGKPAHVRELFDRFRAMVEGCGPVKMLPYRNRVGFMVRVRFAGAVPGSRWLDVGFWLPRRIESPRFRKVETIYPNAHLHRLRVTEPGQLDRELAAWLREAYACGRQEHLTRR